MSEVDDAVERLSVWLRDYGDVKPQIFVRDVTLVLRELAAARTLLREARDTYADHDEDCEWLPSPDRDCTCGFDEWYAKARAAGGGDGRE